MSRINFKQTIYVSILLVLRLSAYSQNYVQTYDVQKEDVTESMLNASTPTEDAIQTKKFYDGLGRLIQTVQIGTTNIGSYDIIIPNVYNGANLDEYNYQPFTDFASNGNFRNDFISGNKNFYDGEFGDNYGFAPAKYDNSPLKRLIEQGFPGEIWQLGGKSVKYEYLTNSSVNNELKVSNWSIDNNGNCQLLNCYPNGKLSALKTITEDGTIHYEFHDLQGKTILQRDILNGINVDTYFIYDDYALLRYIISPQGSSQINTVFNSENDLAKRFVYCFKYDEKNDL
jgi:hypothetical protein